jgi:hypothetical protein
MSNVIIIGALVLYRFNLFDPLVAVASRIIHALVVSGYHYMTKKHTHKEGSSKETDEKEEQFVNKFGGLSGIQMNLVPSSVITTIIMDSDNGVIRRSSMVVVHGKTQSNDITMSNSVPKTISFLCLPFISSYGMDGMDNTGNINKKSGIKLDSLSRSSSPSFTFENESDYTVSTDASDNSWIDMVAEL